MTKARKAKKKSALKVPPKVFRAAAQRISEILLETAVWVGTVPRTDRYWRIHEL